MSDEKLKIEDEMMTDEPLSEEEEAEIDRLLNMTAEADDAKVDYAGIHDAVLEKARAEGIAVFPANRAESRKKTVRRVLAGVGTAAAVFAIGFFAVSVIRNSFPFLGSSSPRDLYDAESQPGRKEAYVTAPAANLLPAETTFAIRTEQAPEAVETGVPFTPAPTSATKNRALETPLPTEYAARGTRIGYLLVCPFTVDPVDSPELLPELPDFMETEVHDTDLYAAAYGVKDGREYVYKCFESQYAYPDSSLGVGVARMTAEDTGLIRFTWRVTDDCWIEVFFEGFTEEEAVSLLKTLPLCDLTVFEEAA